MEKLSAKQAWAISYDPSYLMEMGVEYDADRLEQLNEYLAKGDYTVVSDNTQGYPGDLVIDYPLNMEEPYRALILLNKS